MHIRQVGPNVRVHKDHLTVASHQIQQLWRELHYKDGIGLVPQFLGFYLLLTQGGLTQPPPQGVDHFVSNPIVLPIQVAVADYQGAVHHGSW
jgi:hypothetical protein